MTSPAASHENRTPSAVHEKISTENDEEIITQLTLAGLKVLMVRKKDQIIYKLPDNMSVTSIGEDQRKQLMTEIQTLHAATMAAATAKATQSSHQTPLDAATSKTIAPKQNGFAVPLPANASQAEAEALKETARNLREEMERQNQNQAASGAEVRQTRKYIKTGKYSKKRMYQHQHQGQQGSLDPPNLSAQLSQQQLLALQQSLQAASVPVQNAPHAMPQPAKGFSLSPGTPLQPLFTKRLKEEEDQYQEVKKRFTEALVADQKAVTQPDYDTTFTSLDDAIQRLLPYHIYQYPKGDLDANRIPMERLDETMLEIFRCQSKMFEKHAVVTERVEKNLDRLTLQVLIERQRLSEQRQRLTEEQTRVAEEQANQQQQQQMMRLQSDQARLASASQPFSPTASLAYAQASALLQSPQFANQYSKLSPELQQQLLRNREQLAALIEQHKEHSLTPPASSK